MKGVPSSPTLAASSPCVGKRGTAYHHQPGAGLANPGTRCCRSPPRDEPQIQDRLRNFECLLPEDGGFAVPRPGTGLHCSLSISRRRPRPVCCCVGVRPCVVLIKRDCDDDDDLVGCLFLPTPRSFLSPLRGGLSRGGISDLVVVNTKTNSSHSFPPPLPGLLKTKRKCVSPSSSRPAQPPSWPRTSTTTSSSPATSQPSPPSSPPSPRPSPTSPSPTPPRPPRPPPTCLRRSPPSWKHSTPPRPPSSTSRRTGPG
ncbi:hypothetical protein QBC39DRAFT_344781 [Podospora conica]|nr:hypothetical protein QBC39DRAFT_344781 [Schizothecium conicum]